MNKITGDSKNLIKKYITTHDHDKAFIMIIFSSYACAARKLQFVVFQAECRPLRASNIYTSQWVTS